MKSFSILFSESIKEVDDLNEQIQLLDEMPGANMDTRAVHKHLKKQGWSLTRSSGGHDVFTHPDAKHHIPVPRHRQLKAPLIRGILKQSEVHKEEVEASHKKILDKAKTSVPRVPKSEYERKVVSYLKKKYMKEDVELDEARVAASASARAGIAKRSAGQPKKSTLSPAEQQAKSKESDDSFARLMAHVAAQKAKTNENVEHLEEGRPSQRHPLEGHEYHKKTDAELEYIAKDAHKAAEAMKGHNTDAENKYRDQASDSATVRYFRKKNGMQPWYKKKYGHVNEEVEQIDEAGNKPLEPHIGMGDSRTPRELKTQMSGASTDFVKSTAAKKPGMFHSKVSHMQNKLAKSELRKRTNEEVVEEGLKPGQGSRPGWMLKADPKLGAAVEANKKRYKAFTQNVGKKIEPVKEDNVINANSQNSIDGIKPPEKKKPAVDRYMTGQSTQVAGTNVVASPRESVQEGVAMDIAKMAARRNAGLSEDNNNDNTLSSYDKDDTPAKKTLSKTAGMVKDLAKNAKAKAKTKKSDDTFQPEPELASNIVR